MRFTSTARPSLTPLGHRLLNLSESKLANLEPGLGGKDTAIALWKGVVVREAVKSAWKSVEQGSLGEMNDWHSQSAMGLDVIGEDEEEEVEERWFEDLISTFGDEETASDVVYQHEWVESNVAGAFDDLDDVEYDDEDMQAYTLPVRSPILSPARSPTLLPTSPTLVSVEEVEVDIIEAYYIQPAQPILTPLARPIIPITPSGSPISPLSLSPFSDDLDENTDDFLLPPRLVRTLSSSSTSSLEDDPCLTPPLQSFEFDGLEDEIRHMKIEDGFSMTKKSFGADWMGLGLDNREDGLRLVF